MTRILTDENHSIVGFPYHDGYLDGVFVASDGKEAHLALRSIGGERRVLTLRNTIAFHVQEFRQGNIVLDLQLFPFDAVDDEFDNIFETRLHLDKSKLSHDATVFRLESSYGADVVAVCGNAEVSEVGVTFALTR